MVVQIDWVVGPFSMRDANVESSKSPSAMVQKVRVKVGCKAFLHHEIEGGSGCVKVGGILGPSSQQGDEATCFVKKRATGAKNRSARPWIKRGCRILTFHSTEGSRVLGPIGLRLNEGHRRLTTEKF